MLTVCTGWSPRGWIEYGQNFVAGFYRHWPREINLLAYTEAPVHLPRGACKSIWDIPGCPEFIERHRGNKEARGKEPNAKWKGNAIARGYNWRFDAWKFCRQGFIPLAAAREVGEGLLLWIDADVVTFKDIPSGFFESLLPDGHGLSYLGRNNSHSEIGFQLYRIPQAMNMLSRFRDYYATDAVFGLSEWHSAYVFDQSRRESGIKARNLTPGGSGHVWFQSPLGNYMDHLKGDRKILGRSNERA